MAVRKSAPKQSKTALAKELGISRSALYYQPKLPAKDLKLKAAIEQVMARHKSYGHKRIADAMPGVNKKRILRVMKLFGLKPKRKRKVPFKRNDVNQAPMTIANLIMETAIKAQNDVWVSDFTYLPFYGKFLYLATVEDIFTRKIVGRAVSFKHDVNLVAQALLSAVAENPTAKIIHSDQGSEYRDKKYINLLKSLDIKQSMSQKASPWQNGYQESFYSEFKLELGHPECYQTVGELLEAINGQICYYNNERIHSALRCPPNVFIKKINLRYQLALNTINSGQQVNLLTQPVEKGQVV